MANNTSRGFTIVELLIVVVVIAILAAIVIVTFGGIQSRAHDAAIRSDFHSLANYLKMYRSENGTYPYDPAGNPGVLCDEASSTAIRPLLTAIPMKLSVNSYDTTVNANVLYMASNDGQHFALLAFAQGNPTYFTSDVSSNAEVYVADPAVPQSRFPSGTPCGIADNLGVSQTGTHTDFGFYYVFVRGAGGFRIWN